MPKKPLFHPTLRAVATTVVLAHALPITSVLAFVSVRVLTGFSLESEAESLQLLLKLDPLAIGGDRVGSIKFLIVWHQISVLLSLACIAIGIMCAPLFGPRSRKLYWQQIAPRSRWSFGLGASREAISWACLGMPVVFGVHKLVLLFCESGGGAYRLGAWLQTRNWLLCDWLVSALAALLRSSLASTSGYVYSLPPLPWMFFCMVLPGLAVAMLMKLRLAALIRNGDLSLQQICACGYSVLDLSVCPECGRSHASHSLRKAP